MFERIVDPITAGAAIVAVCVSLCLLRMQMRDRRRELQRTERAVAERVSCWASWSEDGIPVLSGAVIRDPVVCVSDQSEEPVFGVFFDYRDQEDGHPIRIPVGVVPPGTMREVVLTLRHKTDEHWVPEHLLPVLYFRDARNRWWYRNTVGFLEKDPGPGNDGFWKAEGELTDRVTR